jgi:hypothetical protein
MHIPYVRFWPYLLVVLFGVFLFLQLAMFTGGRRAANAVSDGSVEAADAAGIGN